MRAGTGASNVVPGSAEILFNFRFSTASAPDALKARVHDVLDRHGVEYELQWVLGGKPYLTPRGTLVEAAVNAIRAELGVEAELSTTGGTSDGRFIADICPQVVEFGPANASIHKIDECIPVDAIAPLARCYRRILDQLLVTAS